jgi:membrane-associated PAP2 superfamily phosphatase
LVEPIVVQKKVFIISHLLFPMLGFATLIYGWEIQDLDTWLASHFYNPVLKQWPYRNSWLTQALFHQAGRYSVYTLGGVLLGICLLALRAKSRFYPLRRDLFFLLLASLTGPLIITFLKSNTHIYCPWDLALFGGKKPYVRLFDAVDATHTVGHCFPSGHSGLGFTLVSFYFFFLAIKPRYKYWGLWMGLVMGWLFGINQQVRGAHFFSHDLFSLAICWFTSSLLFLIFYRNRYSDSFGN